MMHAKVGEPNISLEQEIFNLNRNFESLNECTCKVDLVGVEAERSSIESQRFTIMHPFENQLHWIIDIFIRMPKTIFHKHLKYPEINYA